jgi:predicted transcriptional regulator of viral defense system
MTTLKDTLVETENTNRVLTEIDLDTILGVGPVARYGLVNKALKRGEIIKLRRGLYVMSDKYRQMKLSKFYLANRIVPNCYLSLESALSLHGWIPEQVTTINCVYAGARNKTFHNVFGDFIFYPLRVHEYEFFTGIDRVVAVQGQPFLLASPLRALADYVYIKKLDHLNLDYLVNSMRIELENITQIGVEQFEQLKKVFYSRRVLQFLISLEDELKKYGN